MGYRLYIGKMKSKVYEKIRFMDEKELMKKFPETIEGIDNDIYCNFRLLPLEPLFCFGKYYVLPCEAEPVFIQKMNFEVDHDFKLISKDQFAQVIEERRTNIINIYLETLNEGPEECRKEIKTIINEFRNFILIGGKKIKTAVRAYNLDSNVKITDSYMWIFSIFELIHIYKTFDWKNNVMIFYGW